LERLIGGPMGEKQLIEVFVNPLNFIEADDLIAGRIKEMPSDQKIVRYLCDPNVKSDLQDVIQRYGQICKEEALLFAVPYEPVIFEKLIWPIKNAKASFILGNYLGTIALCGMVAEMIAIMLFDMYRPQINGQMMTEKDEVSLYGSKFEKLTQERRIGVLTVSNIIGDEIRSYFNNIRILRRQYLHLWSHKHSTILADSITCYKSAVKILSWVIGQDVKEGILQLKPTLMKYLGKVVLIEETTS
jgi:hypothetical protein